MSLIKMVTLLFVALGSAAAVAQPGPPPPNYPPAPPPSPYPPPTFPVPPPSPYLPPPGYPAVLVQVPPGYHEHDGFYLRMFLGPGYTSASSTIAGVDVKVHGGGAGLGVAMGGAVAPNLVVYGEFLMDEASGPDVEGAGVTVTTSGDTTAGVSAVGPGIAYYVMPLDLYLSATLAFARLRVSDNNGNEGQTDTGAALSLMIGKEWWVSRNWGIGVAAHLLGASMKDSKESGSPTWSVGSFAIAFSATFN